MGEVERRHRDVFQEDILPYIHLGPVGDREHTEVLAHVLSAVEDVPELRALVLRVPLSEFVTMTEEAFLGTSFFLISSGTTDGCIEFIFLQGVEQGSGLQFVAGSIITRFFLHSSLVDAFLHAAHDEFGS